MAEKKDKLLRGDACVEESVDTVFDSDRLEGVSGFHCLGTD